MQSKKEIIDQAFDLVAHADGKAENIKANNEQRQKTNDQSKELTRKKLEKLSQENEKNKLIISELRENVNILKWLPRRVVHTSVVSMIVYFGIVIFSGYKLNNFELDPVVLSSIGVSVVGGTFGLIAYILRGIFKLQSKQPQNKSK